MTDIRKEVFLLAKERLKTGNVLLELATSVGKTKISLDLAEDFGAQRVVVLVPTEAVGESWSGEIKKWKSSLYVDLINYKSAHKVVNSLIKPDLVIMDECHHVTPLNLEHIRQYDCPLIGLSATVDFEKLELLKQLGMDREISVSLDEATEHDIVAPYEMYVINFPVDGKTLNIEAGNKTKKWMTTESASLSYMETRIGMAKRSGNQQSIQFAYMARTRLIRTLPSRTRIAKLLLARLRTKNPDSKILLFAPEIAICEDVVPACNYHSKSDDTGFNAFKAGTEPVLGSVNALSEGINVHADMALIMAGMAKERHTVQRLGRLLRKTKEGKMGKAFLLVARDTQDEVWAEDSLANLANVKHYKAEDLGLV